MRRLKDVREPRTEERRAQRFLGEELPERGAGLEECRLAFQAAMDLIEEKCGVSFSKGDRSVRRDARSGGVYKIKAIGKSFIVGGKTADDAVIKFKKTSGIGIVDRVYEWTGREWWETPWREAKPLPKEIRIGTKKLVRMIHPDGGEIYVESNFVEDMKSLGWIVI